MEEKWLFLDYLEDLLTAKKNTRIILALLAYLRGETKNRNSGKTSQRQKECLRIAGGKIFNIKNMNVEVPLGVMTSITGVSGSGKSSFMYEILYKNLQARYERKYRTAKIFNCASFSGTEYLSRAILIDQSPIGRTPRSNHCHLYRSLYSYS